MARLFYRVRAVRRSEINTFTSPTRILRAVKVQMESRRDGNRL